MGITLKQLAIDNLVGLGRRPLSVVTRRRPDELDTNADFLRIGHVGAAAEAEIENRRLVIWDQVQQPLALL